MKQINFYTHSEIKKFTYKQLEKEYDRFFKITEEYLEKLLHREEQIDFGVTKKTKRKNK